MAQQVRQWILTGVFLSLLAQPAHAINLSKALTFTGGVVSGIFLHEVGHWIVGRLFGLNMQITSLTTTTAIGGTTDPVAAQWTTLGGYLMQTALSEFILAKPELHENDFALGIMSFGLENNLSNVIQYYLTNNLSDLINYHRVGGNAEIPAVILGLQSLNGFRRVMQDTQILPYLRNKVLEF